METQVLSICGDSLIYAAELIRSGEVVAFPTETVYGLGANCFCLDAVQKIYAAKGRPSDNPLIVHLCDASQVEQVAYITDKRTEKLFFELMPSSLTVVVPKRKCVDDVITAGLDTVAVRIPQSKQARDFIAQCKVPICAPSANKSGRPSPTTAEAVYADMAGKIPLILKGDDCNVGIESTVLSMVGTPTILRPGIVTQDTLEKVLGCKVEVAKNISSKVNSPGVRYTHYAPSCPCELFLGGAEQVVEFVKERKGQNPVILCKQQFVRQFQETQCQVINLGKDDVEAARNYYSSLVFAEKKYNLIVLFFEPQSQEGESLLNRMQKSAHK